MNPDPQERASAAGIERRGMLPGMAAIGIFLLAVSMITAFKMINEHTLPTITRCTVLAVCTAIVIGVFGMLRLRRWGWVLVTVGCLMGAVMNFFAFHASHIGGYLIQGLFTLLFFLYLSRPEVRERLH